MRIQLIVNVSASAVTPRVRVVIAQALAAEHDLEVAQTSARGHATDLAAEAAEDGREVVAVLGGDGTLNEAANGLVGTATSLAVLPGGSTNVLARTLGAKPDPVEATTQLLGALRAQDGSWRRRIGLGVVNGRHFLFHASVGFDAAIVERVERRSRVKRYASHPLFVATAVDTWLRHYDRKRPGIQLKSGEQDPEQGFMAVLLNSDPYTYAGRRPLHLAPGTTLEDDLSVVLVRSLALHSLLGLAWRAAGTGRRVARHPKVHILGHQREVLVESVGGPVPHQCDGEFLGLSDHILIGHRPDALDLVSPLGASTPARPRPARPWRRGGGR